MIAAFPKDLSAEHGAGMLAVLVLEPETPLEHELARDVVRLPHLAGNHVWRITLWRDGFSYLGAVLSPDAPSLAAITNHQANFPLFWTEVLRPTQS